MHTQTHRHMHAHRHTHRHTPTPTPTGTGTHARTHARTHTHTLNVVLSIQAPVAVWPTTGIICVPLAAVLTFFYHGLQVDLCAHRDRQTD